MLWKTTNLTNKYQQVKDQCCFVFKHQNPDLVLSCGDAIFWISALTTYVGRISLNISGCVNTSTRKGKLHLASEPLILHLQCLVDSGLRMKLDVLHGRGHRAAFSLVSVRILWRRECLNTWFVLLPNFGFSRLGRQTILELTGMIFGPLNVCVKKQCKDSCFLDIQSILFP